MMLEEEVANSTVPVALTPQSGMMIHDAWLFVAPVGQGDYAIIVRATGLDMSSDGAFIVEGVSKTGSMDTLPISGNATTSEFHSDGMGDGVYFTILMANPHTTFESIKLLFLPGMSMTNAELLATANLT
jgi:hypothetical protein